MNTKPSIGKPSSGVRDHLLLNLGCGTNFHPNWCNVDLVPRSSEVIPADLSRGIPFNDGSAAVVYHSHVLEHLCPPDARKFVAECFRVLKPGGTIRIVVPDLEQIAGQYLETIYRAWQEPTAHALANHRWMQLEMIDQIVRHYSGGEMGKYMSDPQIANADFVQQRLGHEFTRALEGSKTEGEKPESRSTNQDPSAKTSKSWMEKLKRKMIRLFFGKEFLAQMDEIQFRQSGEIHQWMYDRVSLRQLLTEEGFVAFTVCTASESVIPDFASYDLDAKDGKTLKPDSIFVEAQKPTESSATAA